ncbi:MAG: SH3 domain-containing protein [Pseudomonadota bacterium]
MFGFVSGLLISPVLTVSHVSTAQGQSAGTGQTGFPVPRFVSLKSERVNMRIGPGRQFKVVWLYLKKGLPIEIIQEYDNWRKVRDPEGNEGWILHSLLSGKRTVIVNPGEQNTTEGIVDLYDDASTESSVIARVEPGVVTEVKSCQDNWCLVSAQDVEGYLEKKFIWGVYPDEIIEQ